MKSGGSGAGTLKASRNRSRLLDSTGPVVTALAVLAAWAVLSQTPLLPPTALPGPASIFHAFIVDLPSDELWAGIWASIFAWIVGLLAAMIIAIPLGALLGLSGVAFRFTYLTIEFLRTVPVIAALPVLVIMLGVGQELTITLVALTAAWPLLIQVTYGFRDIDPMVRETARVFRIGPVRTFTQMLLPSSLPQIVTGVRIASLIGLAVSIATSLIVGGDGLGEAIQAAAYNGDVPLMYSRILVGGLLGVVLTIALTWTERRTLSWHTSQRKDKA